MNVSRPAVSHGKLRAALALAPVFVLALYYSTMPAQTHISIAPPDRAAALSQLEKRAAQMFLDIGMDSIADAPASPPAQYKAWCEARRVLALDVNGRLAGLLVHSTVDGITFVDEVSIDPRFSGNGYGAQLLASLSGPISLTTFCDVPWNAPYYRRLGFESINAGTLGPQHVEIARDETRRFAPWPRCVMVRGNSSA